MSFMRPEISHGRFQVVHDTNEGDIIVPIGDSQYPGDEEVAKAYGVPVENVEVVTGFGARLSASGYLDCTDWAVFDTEKGAAIHLLNTFGNDEEPEDWEAAVENFIGD